MFGYFLAELVEHCFCSGILHHAGLEAVRREDAGHSRKIAVDVHMAGPASTAETTLCRRSRCRAALPQTGIRPVSLQYFRIHRSRWRPAQSAAGPHRASVPDAGRVWLALAELGGLAGRFSILMALPAVFPPQQTQRGTALLHFPAHPLGVRPFFVLRPLGSG